MIRPTLAVLVLGITACSDDPGLLSHGIVAGQNQQVVAGATELEDPVAWALTRTKDGRIVLQRVIDPLLPKLAYAQGTVVRGSPVPGAVVCATENGMKPFVPCTNTDANGMATFFYEVKTHAAGEYKSEIRGTLNSQPAVFDTARMTVVAGEVDPNLSINWAPIPSPAILVAESVADVFQNKIQFRIVSDGRIAVGDTALASAGARTVTFAASYLDSLPGVLELRGQGDVLLARVGYSFLINDDKPSIRFRVRGLNLTP
jgi:hypothetical protein